MPAVVRVKRRIDEEPLSAFVLNGKKRRLDETAVNGTAGTTQFSSSGEKDEISTVLKFAGTIKEQDNQATTQLARLTKDAAKELVQQRSRRITTTNLTERARQEMRQSLHENRFRVVNCMRTTLDVDDDVEDGAVEKKKKKEITIVDIEKQGSAGAGGVQLCGSGASTSLGAASTVAHKPGTRTSQTDIVTSDAAVNTEIAYEDAINSFNPYMLRPEVLQPTDSDSGYVYDLYLPENEQQAEYADQMDDNYLSIRPCDNLVYEDCFNGDEDDEFDSDDSNQEDYFTNDYPDEEDDSEFNSDDGEEDGDTREMRLGIQKFVFNDDDDDDDDDNFDSDSSSDYYGVSYTDPYIHTNEDEDEEECYYDVDHYVVP